MRTRLFLLTVLALGGTTLLSSCFIVDTGALVEETDGGVGLIGAETCGDVTAPVLQPGQSIEIDTTGMQSNQSASLCAGQWREPAAGADAFFRIQVADGEYWHFHVETLTSGRDPFVYVLPPNCSDSQICTPARASNRCTEASPPDEHFGVEFNQSGFWYLGIDDVETGGGRYRVSVFKPNCGDGEAVHGEACDGDVALGQDTCSDDCHLILPAVQAPTTTEGSIPNDDHFWAPQLRVDAVNPTLRVDGAVRGVCDPDVFRITVPEDDNADSVRVRLIDPNTSLCILSAPPLKDIIVNFVNAANAGGTMGANMGGCYEVAADNLQAGQYFIEVSGGNPDANAVYNLQVQLVP